jgi:hypothetical protein
MNGSISRLGKTGRTSRRADSSRNILLITVFALALVAAPLSLSLRPLASTPAGATLNPSSTAPLNWTGSAVGGGALNDAVGVAIRGEDLCQEGLTCDTFTLTIGGTPADWNGKQVRVKLSWLLPATDYDLYIHKDSNAGPVVATSGNGATNPTGPLTSEEATISPFYMGTGVYTVRAVYYLATAADQYKGSATVEAAPAEPPPTPTPTPSAEAAPGYQVFPAPAGVGEGAGEPTLGANWRTGNAIFLAGFETLRVKFDDLVSPAKATWTDVSATTTGLVSADPMLFTDSEWGVRTGRTFVSQLLGKASAMAFTDDDGQTWTPSQGSGINSGVDHQTIGGGPYAKNADGSLKGGAVQHPGINGQIYPNAIYYASQDAGLAEIARSDDGGMTFGVAVPMWTLVQCKGLHGHIKVAPDGTVYVPNKSCGGAQGVAVSEDNGLTWAIRTVPGSTEGDTDPSVGIASDNTVYFAWADGDGHERAAVSHNRGVSWENVTDIGAAHGVRNSVFSATVAGDPQRAAVFFLGSTTPGANGRSDDATFPGTWYGYIASTFDGGKTWVTANAAGDPVQRGPVCTNGPTCADGTRVLLDFNDLVVDQKGRVLAGFADGCVTSGCISGTDKNGDGRLDNRDNDNTEHATIIRQSTGKRLFAAYDPPVNAAPEAPSLTATSNQSSVSLSWTAPFDNGSPVTGYRVYRGIKSATGTYDEQTGETVYQSLSESLIATTGASALSYTDPQASNDSTYYRVTATNANGEGKSSRWVTPTLGESACRAPGLTVITDPSGDSLDQQPQHDIRALFAGEPFYADGSNKVVFTIKMESMSGALTPNTQWVVYFTGADNKGYFVRMQTDMLGAASFKYGTYVHNTDNTAGASTVVGDLDAGSRYDAATGTITLVVSNSKIGNPRAGDTLSRIFVRVPVVAVVPDNANYSSPSTEVKYRLVGNASCR